MTLKYSTACCLAALAFAACDSGGAETAPSPETAPSFRPLGSPSGGREGVANGVSDDGDVVVGVFLPQGSRRAFRWTDSDGPVGLAAPPTGTGEGPLLSAAEDVSGDGGVVVGGHRTTTARAGAFRWTAAGGAVDLGRLPKSPAYVSMASAYGVSADGDVVVGETQGEYGRPEAFRWTASGGMEPLCCFPVPNSSNTSTATDVSDDGAVVVGWSLTERVDGDGGQFAPFRWTRGGGVVFLGGFPLSTVSQAFAVSGDGAVVVGQGGPDPNSSVRRAFRWTADRGVVWLSEYPSGAYAVSLDGRAVVGSWFVPGVGEEEAFYWTAGGAHGAWGPSSPRLGSPRRGGP